MLAKVLSCATVGLDGALVEVEVFANSPLGQPGIVVVGLPDAAVQESRERVRAAIRSSGGRVPFGRIIVNLAPADLRKEGPAYDLPIALGLLIAGGSLQADLDDAVVIGELSLDGTVRHTTGVLPMVALAARSGLRRAFVPFDDADEAALVDGIDIYPIDTLAGLMRHLTGDAPIPPYRGKADSDLTFESLATDFAVIRGQEQVKRGLEVAAAGGHNVIMAGPPGTGKTLLARALPSILPPLARDDAIEVSKIYSVAGMLPAGQPLIRERPFRSPHHTVSYAGLVGGGRFPRPGEISLAHRGVLFLDELPEFGQNVLEVLRQPLEDRIVTISRASGAITYPANFILVAAMNPCPCGYAGDPVRECTCSASAIQRYQKRISGPLLDRIDIHLEVLRQPLEDRIVTISRASGAITYPANFILVAAMNPCPCGYAGDPVRECTCSASAIQRYQKRISGPLLDRIDIHLEVPRIEYEKLSDSRAGEPSATIRARVEAARELQSQRLAGTALRTNADMGAKEVQQHCFLDNASETLMRSAMRQLQLSARSYHRILKLARTIADLAGEETIRSHHLAEALQYRPKVIA